jgi:hypothetical protein
MHLNTQLESGAPGYVESRTSLLSAHLKGQLIPGQRHLHREGRLCPNPVSRLLPELFEVRRKLGYGRVRPTWSACGSVSVLNQYSEFDSPYSTHSAAASTPDDPTVIVDQAGMDYARLDGHFQIAGARNGARHLLRALVAELLQFRTELVLTAWPGSARSAANRI